MARYQIDQFVAHRGLQRAFPENSLAGFYAALDAGARHLECDVQLSQDAVPLLYHDATLKRVSGQPGNLFDLPAATLQQLPANEPSRLNGQYEEDCRITPLAALADIAAFSPDVTLYVELKEESITTHGLDICLQQVHSALEPFIDQCYLISFDGMAIKRAKTHFGFKRTGLVFRDWRQRQTLYQQTLADIAYINYRRIKDRQIESSIPLVVYEVPDAKLARRLLERGVDKVESFAVDRLIEELC